ncbi:MAG: diguanylate cyclase [Gemmatimonadaceae bacterium]
MPLSVDVLLQQAQIAQGEGRLDDAAARILEARARAVESGNTRLAATLAGQLAFLAQTRGDHDTALRYYRLNLSELRALGAPREVLGALGTLGRLFTDLERWDDAASAFEEAIHIADGVGAMRERIVVEVHRAALEIERGDLGAARDACDLAKGFIEITGDERTVGDIEKHLGTIARELGDLSAAESHLEHALSIAQDRGDLLLSAETEREQAALCRRQGRHRDALLHLNRGHRLFSALAPSPAAPDLHMRLARLERQFADAVRHWAGSIESKDRYTQGHCERVADLASAIALRAGFDRQSLFWFRVGAIVHDVGKLIVPSELLNKPGTLAQDEWELIKRHPVAGVEMLSDMDFPPAVLRLVRSHHERADGKGYPDGLRDDDIPQSARILCIADVYDALTARRSYKGVLTHDSAMEIMRADIGKQFDAELFAHFEALMRARAPSLRQRLAIEPTTSSPSGVRDLAIGGPTDDLTGVLMRRPFVEVANKILAERGPFATVSLIVIDVDSFKPVNDTHGHLQGDAVLRVVAGTLRELAAATGIVGRYAGDEFVILLPHTTLGEAAELADRIRVTVPNASVPLRERAGSISVTLSLGVATARADTPDFESLFEAADRALYEAKRRGRDTVVTANPEDADSRAPTLNLKTFVGRDDEFHRLKRALELTCDSGARIACITGEAGVGKTALVKCLSAELHARGGLLAVGRCTEADAKPPLAPWAEALASLNQHDASADRLSTNALSFIASLTAARSEPGAKRYELLDGIVSFVRLASVECPVAILIDDAQWADAATWDAIEYVIGALEHERVLICLTMRTEDTRGEALVRRNRLLRDERFHEIALSRLSEAVVHQWLSAVFGGEATRELIAYLHRHSEGNPLLATQLVRTLFENGAVRHENGRWTLRSERDQPLPIVLTGLMDRRLERLAPDTRAFLNTAAVIGREFDIDLAIAAGAATEDETLDAIDDAIAHGVIESRNDASGANFAFTHGLLVDAIHRGINSRRLARIHERIARAMETVSSERAAEIALHYDRAGIPRKPYRYAMIAGGASAANYARSEARQFFEIAERAAADSVERADALRGLADVAEAEGRYALTEELCDRALAGLGGRPDDRASLGLKRRRLRTRALQGQPANETIAACRDLLVIARNLDDLSEQAAVLNMISQYQARLGQWADAEEVAREAVDIAQRSGDARLLANALVRLGTSMMEAHTTQAAESYQRARSLFRTAGDAGGEARCDISLGRIAERAGDCTAAEAGYARAHDAATRARANDLVGVAALRLGVLSLRRGQLDIAERRYHEAIECFRDSSNESHRLSALSALAHLARESDDWATASALYGQVVATAARVGKPEIELGARAGQGLAALAVGSRSVAEDAMRWIRANVDSRPEWWFEGRDLVDALRIRLAAERGDDAHALRLLHEAVAIAGRFDPYAAAHLLAECAPSLRRSTDALIDLIDRISLDVDARGFARIAERLSVLRVALGGVTQAA